MPILITEQEKEKRRSILITQLTFNAEQALPPIRGPLITRNMEDKPSAIRRGRFHFRSTKIVQDLALHGRRKPFSNLADDVLLDFCGRTSHGSLGHKNCSNADDTLW